MAKSYPFLITPRCTFLYPHLNEADRKYQPDGEFNVTCVLDADDKILARIEEIRDEFYPVLCEQEGKKKLKMADLPFKTQTDDEDEPTGNVTIRPKAKALVRYTRNGEEKSFPFRPDLVDATGTARVKSFIGGGSEGKVKFEIVPYYTALMGMGVTLRLKAVQVLELVAPGGNNLEGFEAEDGFTADPDDEVEAVATTADADADGEEGDF